MSEEIKEGIELIKKFIEFEDGYNEHGSWIFFRPNEDWNQLMPVCKKISDLEPIRMPCNTIKDSVTPHIKAMGEMKNGAIRFDLERTFNGVVKFIKWYNTNTNTNTPQPN